MQIGLTILLLFINMNSYDLIKAWRNSLKEQDEKPAEKQLKIPADTPAYDKLVSQAKDNVESPTEKKELSKDCKVKSTCNCLDSSETNLTLKQIQQILNNYFSAKKSDISLPVSGDCDTATQQAILRFQDENGLECDACVGDETEGKMAELKLINKEQLSGGNPSSDNTGPAAAVGSFSAGATLSIKSIKPGLPPHSKFSPNYHGYSKKKNPIHFAYLINGVDFGPAIDAADGIKSSSRHTHQFGNPILLDIIVTAAKAVYAKFPTNDGLPVLWNVSRKEGGAPMKGWWHWGHQSGLEADITFYVKGKKSMPIQGVSKRGLGNLNPRFDMERNCLFLQTLLSAPQVEGVLLEPKLITIMRQAAPKLGYDLSSPKLLPAKSASKFDKGSGHNNHYHVRVKFPPNSMNMDQYKQAKKTGNLPTTKTGPDSMSSTKVATSAGSQVVAAVTGKMSSIRQQSGGLDQKIVAMYKQLMRLGLGDIQKMYGNQFGYALGLVSNSEPSIGYNHNLRFYGASSPKTMAGLVQMIKYRGTGKSLNNKELAGLLTYKAHAGKNSGSNGTNRAISATHRRRSNKGRFPAYKRKSGPSLGSIDISDVKPIAAIFGINNAKFLWGRSNNQQSPKDMFKFFGGLQRMVSGGGTENERRFYQAYKKEVDAIVNMQKRRRHSPRVQYSGVTKRNHWGKGGRALGAVSHTFVIDGKYVLSVYVDLKKTPDHEAYAVLNTVLAKLLEKVR